MDGPISKKGPFVERKGTNVRNVILEQFYKIAFFFGVLQGRRGLDYFLECSHLEHHFIWCIPIKFSDYRSKRFHETQV